MSLTRESIISAQDIKITPVPVPEWGGDVHIKTMTGEVRDEALKGMATVEGRLAKAAHFIVACACDAEGKLLFATEDAKALAKKASHVLAKLFEEALKINSVSTEGKEQTAKN